MVETDGRVFKLLVHAADVQDRDGAVPLLKRSRDRHPFVQLAFADSAYNSPRVAMASSIGIEIVRKFADQAGFVVHPRRWVVERTFAWINRNRRLAKDFEQTIRSATAFLYAASATVLIRRLARYGLIQDGFSGDGASGKPGALHSCRLRTFGLMREDAIATGSNDWRAY